MTVASIQMKNSRKSPKPRGTRTLDRATSENVMGMARKNHMSAPKPSTYQTGNIPNAANSGHP
jgi:hypothetical protein